ncbi:MAG TPA: hypothetical protein PLR41_00665 [Alphaproteobacteria bacterium]|nr:hypothetical protein [Alphaproteobacteria bacterium]
MSAAFDPAPAWLADAVLVVAHPDDEVLWFGSILRAIGRVVIAFRDYDAVPGLGARRAAALAEMPYRDCVSLDLPEAGSLRHAAWPDPRLSEYGLALDSAPVDAAAEARYRANFAALRARLAQALPARAHVVTHNPWGEYGHEDHVQVHRAVDSLWRDLGLSLWTTNYVSSRSAVLAARYAAGRDTRIVKRPIDLDFARGIAEIYRRHDCWTWRDAWTGFDAECLVSLPLDLSGGTGVNRLPLNVVTFDG